MVVCVWCVVLCVVEGREEGGGGGERRGERRRRERGETEGEEGGGGGGSPRLQVPMDAKVEGESKSRCHAHCKTRVV